jgi:ankyrin repeat protein
VGATAFWLAARFGEMQMATTLLAAGANPKVLTQDGTTAVMAAIDAGVDYGPSASDQRNRRLDPLELAAKVERQDDYDARVAAMVDFLIGSGVDVNARDLAGDTAIHFAAAMGFGAVARTLADRGADLTARNKRGQTPLALTRSARVEEGAPSKQAVIDLLRQRGVVE